MSESEPLRIDPDRLAMDDSTRIYIRAQMPDGDWRNVDIACLDLQSAYRWFQANPYRGVACALAMLGHDYKRVSEQMRADGYAPPIRVCE